MSKEAEARAAQISGEEGRKQTEFDEQGKQNAANETALNDQADNAAGYQPPQNRPAAANKLFAPGSPMQQALDTHNAISKQFGPDATANMALAGSAAQEFGADHSFTKMLMAGIPASAKVAAPGAASTMPNAGQTTTQAFGPTDSPNAGAGGEGNGGGL